MTETVELSESVHVDRDDYDETGGFEVLDAERSWLEHIPTLPGTAVLRDPVKHNAG